VPHRLNTFLTANSELSQLTKKARQLMTLQQQLECVIPPSLKRGCRVMQLNQQTQTLTLSADNGAIASKLRQMTTELAAKLRENGCEVTLIQVLVQVNPPPFIPPHQAHILSASGKTHLTELSEKLPDSPLKDALNRLVKRN
jgi:hypothetical protein